MAESKALDEETKMARLLQFLEGPALGAVQRYEAVPGGLAKWLEVLQNRFGKPFKIVRACIDTSTKGLTIAPQAKEGLQHYADIAQVILESMGFLSTAITDFQMHYFSEASNHGYAAGKIHCTFVMGKTRNSPLRQWSIPRLELQTAVVATRLHLLLSKELDIPLHGATFGQTPWQTCSTLQTRRSDSSHLLQIEWMKCMKAVLLKNGDMCQLRLTQQTMRPDD